MLVWLMCQAINHKVDLYIFIRGHVETFCGYIIQPIVQTITKCYFS